jgi:hypothetical protein
LFIKYWFWYSALNFLTTFNHKSFHHSFKSSSLADLLITREADSVEFFTYFSYVFSLHSPFQSWIYIPPFSNGNEWYLPFTHSVNARNLAKESDEGVLWFSVITNFFIRIAIVPTIHDFSSCQIEWWWIDPQKSM